MMFNMKYSIFSSIKHYVPCPILYHNCSCMCLYSFLLKVCDKNKLNYFEAFFFVQNTSLINSDIIYL